MIEVLSNDKGLSVIKYNGKYLSSSIDPVKAAEKWLSDAEDLVHQNLNHYDVIFVVGVGSGYEISQLIKKYPDQEIVIIDTNPVLIDRVKKIHPSIGSKITVFCALSCQEIFKSNFLQELLKKKYMVLSCKNIMRTESYMLNQFYKALCCRSIESFKVFVEHQPNLKSIINMEQLKEKLNKNEVLSIKHLVESIKHNNLKGDYTSELLLTLRELLV